jgi:hypothetical protein
MWYPYVLLHIGLNYSIEKENYQVATKQGIRNKSCSHPLHFTGKFDHKIVFIELNESVKFSGQLQVPFGEV